MDSLLECDESLDDQVNFHELIHVPFLPSVNESIHDVFPTYAFLYVFYLPKLDYHETLLLNDAILLQDELIQMHDFTLDGQIIIQNALEQAQFLISELLAKLYVLNDEGLPNDEFQDVLLFNDLSALVLHVYVLNGHLVYDLHAYAHSIYFPHVKDTQTNEFRASALHAYVPHVDFPHDVPLALANQLYVPHVIALNFYDLLDFFSSSL